MASGGAIGWIDTPLGVRTKAVKGDYDDDIKDKDPDKKYCNAVYCHAIKDHLQSYWGALGCDSSIEGNFLHLDGVYMGTSHALNEQCGIKLSEMDIVSRSVLFDIPAHVKPGNMWTGELKSFLEYRIANLAEAGEVGAHRKYDGMWLDFCCAYLDESRTCIELIFQHRLFDDFGIFAVTFGMRKAYTKYDKEYVTQAVDVCKNDIRRIAHDAGYGFESVQHYTYGTMFFIIGKVFHYVDTMKDEGGVQLDKFRRTTRDWVCQPFMDVFRNQPTTQERATYKAWKDQQLEARKKQSVAPKEVREPPKTRKKDVQVYHLKEYPKHVKVVVVARKNGFAAILSIDDAPDDFYYDQYDVVAVSELIASDETVALDTVFSTLDGYNSVSSLPQQFQVGDQCMYPVDSDILAEEFQEENEHDWALSIVLAVFPDGNCFVHHSGYDGSMELHYGVIRMEKLQATPGVEMDPAAAHTMSNVWIMTKPEDETFNQGQIQKAGARGWKITISHKELMFCKNPPKVFCVQSDEGANGEGANREEANGDDDREGGAAANENVANNKPRRPPAKSNRRRRKSDSKAWLREYDMLKKAEKKKPKMK